MLTLGTQHPFGPTENSADPDYPHSLLGLQQRLSAAGVMHNCMGPTGSAVPVAIPSGIAQHGERERPS